MRRSTPPAICSYHGGSDCPSIQVARTAVRQSLPPLSPPLFVSPLQSLPESLSPPPATRQTPRHSRPRKMPKVRSIHSHAAPAAMPPTITPAASLWRKSDRRNRTRRSAHRRTARKFSTRSQQRTPSSGKCTSRGRDSATSRCNSSRSRKTVTTTSWSRRSALSSARLRRSRPIRRGGEEAAPARLSPDKINGHAVTRSRSRIHVIHMIHVLRAAPAAV